MEVNDTKAFAGSAVKELIHGLTDHDLNFHLTKIDKQLDGLSKEDRHGAMAALTTELEKSGVIPRLVAEFGQESFDVLRGASSDVNPQRLEWILSESKSVSDLPQWQKQAIAHDMLVIPPVEQFLTSEMLQHAGEIAPPWTIHPFGIPITFDGQPHITREDLAHYGKTT